MQVTQTLSEGLKREFKIVVPATDLDQRVMGRLEDLKTKVRINGFRPGKVPVAHLKRVYGKSVFGEVLQEVMAEANRKIVDDNGVKLAMQPKVSLPEEETEVEAVIAGRNDLAYTVALEVLPEIKIGDLKGIAVEKPVAQVADAEIEDALARIARQNQPFSPRPEGAGAETGDRVTIDYKGTIDGEPFEGGEGADIEVELGSGTFIPGFEDQLVGVKSGEERSITAAFPAGYARRELAGKTGVFAVEVRSVAAPAEMPVDDELAKSLGLESLAKLRDAVKEQLGRELASASRQKMKRALLDALDERHQFELPPTLVEQEFNVILAQVRREMEAEGGDEGKSEDDLRAEYRPIAERRVRLGLLLAEIGERNDIKVTDDEVSRGIVERARQFPGREQQVWAYYRNNPEALAEVRAPIFEEKVVDYIAELATVTEKPVSRAELFADEDDSPAATA